MRPTSVGKKIVQSTHSPDTISHRDDQIETIAKILAPCLRLERPSNVFVYGKTGTGKTLVAKYVTEQMKVVASQKELPLKIIYVNCKLKKVADTEYRLIAALARECGKAIPPTGLPTDEVYSIFFKAVDDQRLTLLLILDEIDQLVDKSGDGILYNLTRINENLKQSQISLVGIANSLLFMEQLDPRVKSSLSEEEILFPPYNALQIQSILKQRIKDAFHPGVIQSGVVEKCAAYAAKEHGDARRAIELLRVVGELAERQDKKEVSMQDLDVADDKIEKDRLFEMVRTQPKQFQATLYAIFLTAQQREGPMFTGEIYESYKKICTRTALNYLTQRRVSDVIAELDMLGIINAKVISKGRYGRTREISLTPSLVAQRSSLKNILEEGLALS